MDFTVTAQYDEAATISRVYTRPQLLKCSQQAR